MAEQYVIYSHTWRCYVGQKHWYCLQNAPRFETQEKAARESHGDPTGGVMTVEKYSDALARETAERVSQKLLCGK